MMMKIIIVMKKKLNLFNVFFNKNSRINKNIIMLKMFLKRLGNLNGTILQIFILYNNNILILIK